MLGYLNHKLGNISVAAKLTLGFAVVLLLTLATTVSGWRALDGAIVRSQQLSEIDQINDLAKDLRAERITYRVLSDDTSNARITRILDQLDSMLTTLLQRSNVDESRQLLVEKLALLQRLRNDFSQLQRSVANRAALREAMQTQEEKLNQAIDELQTQALLKMPANSQQSGVLGLMETLSRQVDSANQQSLVPAYTFSPLEDFAKVGDAPLDAADSSLGQLLEGLAPLVLPRAVSEQPGAEPPCRKWRRAPNRPRWPQPTPTSRRRWATRWWPKPSAVSSNWPGRWTIAWQPCSIWRARASALAAFSM